MSDFINPDGSTKLTDEEHLEALKAWHKKNGSLKGFKQTYGLKVDPVKGPMMARAFTNRDGQQYTYNSMSSRKNNDTRRTSQEGKWKTELKTTLDELGRSDEFDTHLDTIKKGNSKWKRRITKLNKGVDKADQVSRGHITAMNKGGLDVPENIMVENRGLNSGRQDFDEAPEINRRMAGSPQSMKEWVFKQDLKNSDPTRDLSTTVQEQILDAKNTQQIDQVLTDYYPDSTVKPDIKASVGNIPSGPRAGQRMPVNRVTLGNAIIDDIVNTGGSAKFNLSRGTRALRALPLVGPVVATVVAGGQALAGDYKAAGGTLLDEGLGEIGLDTQPSADTTLKGAATQHQAISDRAANPTVADKIIRDPVNEGKYFAKQAWGGIKNFAGGVIFGL